MFAFTVCSFRNAERKSYRNSVIFFHVSTLVERFIRAYLALGEGSRKYFLPLLIPTYLRYSFLEIGYPKTLYG